MESLMTSSFYGSGCNSDPTLLQEAVF